MASCITPPAQQPRPKARFGAIAPPAGVSHHLPTARGKDQQVHEQAQAAQKIKAGPAIARATADEAGVEQGGAAASLAACGDASDAPHLLPKVMAPFTTKPGDTPRRVQIQRKRRLYASLDIASLVASEGVGAGQLAHFPLEHWQRLEMFDDVSFESRTAEQWVPACMSPGMPQQHGQVAMRGAADGAVTWAWCAVLEADAARNRYRVQVAPPAAPPAWVPRVTLCFAAEDPVVYARRFAAAHAALAAAHVQLAFELCVDAMPPDDALQLRAEAVNRVVTNALNSKQLQERLMDTSALINEASLEHMRTLNNLLLHRLAAARDATHTDSAAPGQGCAAAEQLLPISVPSEVPRRPVPARATVRVPRCCDFRQRLGEFAFSTLLTRPEAILALSKIRLESGKVIKMSLFNTLCSKSVRLEEFEQAQLVATDSVANHLRDNWSASIKSIIKGCLKDVGKGWFNLRESNYEAYKFSKLRRFLGLVRFSMEDSLRWLVEGSMAKFVGFMQACCSDTVAVDTRTGAVTVELRDLSRKAPLLLTELVTMPDGASFAYSTPVDAIHSRIIAVFDRAVTKLQGLPQLEPAIMDKLFWPATPLLTSVHPQEDATRRARDALSASIMASLQPLRSYLAYFCMHKDLLALDVDAYVGRLAVRGTDLTLAEITSEVATHSTQLAAMAEQLQSTVNLGLVQVNCIKVRDQLLRKKERMVDQLKALAASMPASMLAATSTRFNELERRLRSKAGSLEDVDAQRRFVAELPTKMAPLVAEVEATKPWYAALEDMRYLLPDEQAREKLAGQSWQAKLMRQADRALELLEVDEAKFADQLTQQQADFVGTITDLATSVVAIQKHQDLTKVEEVAAEVAGLDKQLRAAEQAAAAINAREGLLGRAPTDYGQVKQLAELFSPFQQFWSTAASWKANHARWLSGQPLDMLDREAVERDVAAADKVLHKTVRAFAARGLDRMVANVEAVKQQVEAFKPVVPLVQSLRDPGMRARHWDQLSADLGTDAHFPPAFTLEAALGQGLLAHLPAISRVAELASKEFSIEQALDKVQADWEAAELTILDFRDTGTCVVKLEEAMVQQLDDHIVMLQSMSFSPHRKPFEERLAKWDTTLNLVSEVLEQWVALQRTWMSLAPIFSSEDIMQQLPLEGKRFATVDRSWRKTMDSAKRSHGVLKVCASQKLLDQLAEANRLLEAVQKGLADYLESKRMAFARFFFLSNDELLQILSQTKNPLAVQPHLRKCFEAIASLEFAPDLSISAMNSAEGEKVPFDRPMQPAGNVEVWLGEVERRMKASVRTQIMAAMHAAPGHPRPQWVRAWPAMSMLAASQVFWAHGVEEALAQGSLHAFLDSSSADLLALTDLVQGDLTDGERQALSALITIDVHACEVVRELLDAGVTAASDFEWVSRLRYYWRDDLWVDMAQASIVCGYEYLGNTSRLVITPLTDRCYLTLMSAMHLNLGGAPAGPAGTGKTETTKDLAKALAKQCVVFNCSDGLDYIAMGKFFKGLASSGAWACFDEFNRIDVEVLSVIAQQILTIQLAIQAKLKRFIFQEAEINLDAACCVMITMNPGYQGRSELPDNLKALFRPVAMMIPDYSLIGEVALYSFGYRSAALLARKMVATFKLCSEQLSSQDHYDYGMRAVKSVITAAGNLKRMFPREAEDVLLLRALRDVNVPKFLRHDLPLFDGIIADLFPGVQRPQMDNKQLLRAVDAACSDLGLQPVDAFVEKVVQLHETTVVRHGLMLVGPAMAGKTCCYRVLARALSALAAAGVPGFERVHTAVLNPKAVTLGQLFGQFDESTHEWTDGVLATHMRAFAADTTPDKKWMLFDGPVDALWVENLNTVLDDNKKLCLVSGEIIAMTTPMTMMFEVEDLTVASPATVSRCGMIFMQPAALGIAPLLASWLARLPAPLHSHTGVLAVLFQALVPDALHLVRKQLQETVPTADHNLVMSCFNLMDALLRPYLAVEGLPPPDQVASLPSVLPSLFLFAVTWSLGASCNSEGRAAFDAHVRGRLQEDAVLAQLLPAGAAMPDSAPVYEWCFDANTQAWVPWLDTVQPFTVDPTQSFATTLVPTTDTIRYTFLISALLRAGKHVLCVGETGTGKTLVSTRLLQDGGAADTTSVGMTFSARTSANEMQDIIESKMDKRRKGVCGPPAGKRCVLFIDDLNMPQRERFFAQPPLELLRQWFDHGGWYERRPPCGFKSIIDTQVLGAMGPPGGGRNPVPARVIRHFNVISFTELGDDSVGRIFTTILGSFLQRAFGAPGSGSAPAAPDLTGQLVSATTSLYRAIRAELLPTPSKCFYTFNLRDMGKVVQGLMRADPQAGEPQLLPLWLHETSRVFEDRLTCAEDRQWFRQHQEQLLHTHFGQACGEVAQQPDCRRMFGNYLVPGAEPKAYQQVTDVGALGQLMQTYLDDYNASSSTPMRLVLFDDALEHVSRICRIISQPLGNALLLGVDCSGRRSLARLAAFICGFDIAAVELSMGYGDTEWREDLKRVLKRAGLDGQEVVFLISDSQILHEGWLEDLNSILNAGEVPSLMAPEDLEQIATGLRPTMVAAGLPITKASVHTFFIQRVRAALHLVLAFSPVGDAFRQRLRMFPSLVNCTTIDCFDPWPLEALTSVARSFCADPELLLGGAPGAGAGAAAAAASGAAGGADGAAAELPPSEEASSLLEGVLAACVHIHQSVEASSRRYYDELRRHNYVTPASYLELLSTFLTLLADKRADLSSAKARLEGGLGKLTSTARQVEDMQHELQELQPVLASTAAEVEAMMTAIVCDKEDAAATKQAVELQEREANEQAAAAKSIADEAQRELAAALPALDAALASLKNLSRNDVVEVRSLQNPPAGVKLVMEAACILLDEKPKLKDDPSKMGKKVPDYWESSKKLLSDASGFLEALLSFKRDAIPDATIRRIEPYIALPEFTPEAVAKVSKVAPKRAALAAAQESLDKTLAELTGAQARLAAVQDKIASLEAAFEAGTAKKAALAAQVTDCQVKLQRADKLIGGLGGERSRWSSTVQQLQAGLDNLVGDVVLAAGAIAYAGPFVPSYRAALFTDWRQKLAALGVRHSPHASLASTLADPVQVRAWTNAGLPTDTISVENAIISTKARRWPLMIDPQGQAHNWVKAMQTAAGLQVVKPGDKDLMRTLENCVRFGRPALLEDLGEGALDAALEPILLRATFKHGGSEAIRLGDTIVPYHQDFRLVMTTKLRNPHFPAEVAVRVSLLNFLVTPEGLEDQLLGQVVTQERPDLANLKSALVVSNAKMKAELAGLECRILGLLSASSGNILDDEELINTLAQAKVASDEVSARVVQAEATEREIDATRELYRPVAAHASLLFFAISELAAVDPMYQYSLAWFMRLFVRTMQEAPKASKVSERSKLLNAHFTTSLYDNVCRSLFECHKLLFSFMLAVKTLQATGAVDAREWRFLLAGPQQSGFDSSSAANRGGRGLLHNSAALLDNPGPDWLTDKAWGELLGVSELPAFAGLAQHVASNLSCYHALFDSPDAHCAALPEPWDSDLSRFQRLLVLRCLRPDRLLAGMSAFVAGQLGPQFIEPPPYDLAACFKESSPSTPLVFVLSPGADPMADLLKLADELKFSRKFEKVSLGQGQGPKAERLLAAGMERGLWVCLQNCHLAVSWLPQLARIVEGIQPDRVHKDFRLWLTSMPTSAFPASILQSCVKMTLEPPAGLKASLQRQYARFSEAYLAASSKPVVWRRLVYGLCLFHAVVQDRRKFGALGCNIRYDFTEGDLAVSLAQLQEFLDKYETPPFKVLQYLFTEVNYGGRVTDDKDRRLIGSLVQTFCSPSVLQEGHAFSPSGTYVVPGCETVAQFRELIGGLPLQPDPEIFGLHANADITCQQAQAYELLGTVLALQPRVVGAAGGGGAPSQEVVVARIADGILARLPARFDLDAISAAHPATYSNSLNTVLLQEAGRFNTLLAVVHDSLAATRRALDGLVVMSPDLEGVANALADNRVPNAWAARAYPSLKPLAAWVDDLLARVAFIAGWAAHGPPAVFWLSGFFFPQAFLTGTLQNFARARGLPIDTVSFGFSVLDDVDLQVGPSSSSPAPNGESIQAPADGCYVRGLFLEGARWDSTTHQLAESRPRELFTEMPVVWLRPQQHRAKPTSGVYDCPLYKTVARAGTLSTTGHSTNFVMSLELPTGVPPSHWINRGVALFAALAF